MMAMDERSAWSESDYLLARLSDAAELSNYLFIRANSESTEGLEIPKPILRPGATDEQESPPVPTPKFASGEEVVAFFGQMNSL